MADFNISSLITEALDIAKASDDAENRARALSYAQHVQDSVLGRHRFKFCEDRLVETVSEGTTTYDYDCDHQMILQVVLSHLDLNQAYEPKYLPAPEFFERFPLPDTETAGLPEFYTDYGDELYWSRPLDRAYTLGMRYLRASSNLADTTRCKPDLPREFKNIYTEGILAGIERYRENFDLAAIHERTVEDLTEDLLGRYSLRKLQPGKARTTRRRRVEW